MSGIEAATELDRLRRELETVQGGSAIKSERLYELAETCATLRARAERAEADVKSLRHSMRMADCHSEDDWRRLAMHLEWEWGQCSSRLNRAAGDRDAAQAAISELTAQVGRLTDLARHLRGCVTCGEHDVEYCTDGDDLWRAALPPETP